jgi:hypothetical protein
MKYSIVFLIAAFAFAQDKVPMPPQQPVPPAPPAPTSNDTKTVILCKEETLKARDGYIVKTVSVNSEGYSEVRYTIFVKPPAGKRFGPNTKIMYTAATMTMSEGTDVIDLASKRNEKPDGFGRYRELVTVKAHSGRNRIFFRIEDFDLDEAVVTIEAYLVK